MNSCNSNYMSFPEELLLLILEKFKYKIKFLVSVISTVSKQFNRLAKFLIDNEFVYNRFDNKKLKSFHLYWANVDQNIQLKDFSKKFIKKLKNRNITNLILFSFYTNPFDLKPLLSFKSLVVLKLHIFFEFKISFEKLINLETLILNHGSSENIFGLDKINVKYLHLFFICPTIRFVKMVNRCKSLVYLCIELTDETSYYLRNRYEFTLSLRTTNKLFTEKTYRNIENIKFIECDRNKFPKKSNIIWNELKYKNILFDNFDIKVKRLIFNDCGIKDYYKLLKISNLEEVRFIFTFESNEVSEREMKIKNIFKNENKTNIKVYLNDNLLIQRN